MPALDPTALASELLAAYSSGTIVSVPPSSRDPDFDLKAAYAVQAELARLRRASGHQTVGRKVGYANRALWRMLKLDTVLWAHMYDDTVQRAPKNVASVSLRNRCSPKIEPEIVFRLKKPLGRGDLDPAAVLDAIEWLALGFEIIDCVFPAWQFQPADFVAAFGFHAALVVGEPMPIEPEAVTALVDALGRFKLRLLKDEQLVEEGSGKNVLRNPAVCLGELAGSIVRQPEAEPLAPGEIVSSGTLTTAQPAVGGDTWRAVVEGLDLPDLTLRL